MTQSKNSFDQTGQDSSNTLLAAAARLREKDRQEARRTAQATLEDIEQLHSSIQTNPCNEDPQQLERDAMRAVYEVERDSSNGRGLDILTHDKLNDAFNTLLSYGYDTGSSEDERQKRTALLKESISMQELILRLGVMEIKEGLKTVATNSFECWEKYARKRFNAMTAGKSIIYAFVYWGFLKNEGLSNQYLLSHRLYSNMDTIREKVNTVEDLLLYTQYKRLEGWINEAFESALFMRNNVIGCASHLYSIASGAIAGEELRNTLGNLTQEQTVWMAALSVDSLHPLLTSYHVVVDLRRHIDNGLRYIAVYNASAGTVAKAIEVPELSSIFTVTMQPVIRVVDSLNAILADLRALISGRATDTGSDSSAQDVPMPFTPYAKRSALDAFSDVSARAPQVPPRNVADAEQFIRRDILYGDANWSDLLAVMSKDYWRRILR